MGVSESELAMARHSTNIMARLFLCAWCYYDSLDPSSPRAAPQPLPHPPAPCLSPRLVRRVRGCCMLLSCSIASLLTRQRACASWHGDHAASRQAWLHLVASPAGLSRSALQERRRRRAVAAAAAVEGRLHWPAVAHLYHASRRDAIVDLLKHHRRRSGSIPIRVAMWDSCLGGAKPTRASLPHATDGLSELRLVASLAVSSSMSQLAAVQSLQLISMAVCEESHDS